MHILRAVYLAKRIYDLSISDKKKFKNLIMPPLAKIFNIKMLSFNVTYSLPVKIRDVLFYFLPLFLIPLLFINVGNKPVEARLGIKEKHENVAFKNEHENMELLDKINSEEIHFNIFHAISLPTR